MREKKSIYNLSIKEMRGLLTRFSRTLYGRTVFFLAYFLPFMAFLVLIGLTIAAFLSPDNLFYPILGTFFIFIVLFILANIYYYHEMRHFAEHEMTR